MTKKLESEVMPLTRLFSQQFFFRIPEYQRPFLWNEGDFSDLVDDLRNAKRHEPYFLGTLVLHRRDKERDKEYDVVDGQQRLTALCILLACLRDSLGSTKAELSGEIHDKIYQVAKKLDSIPARNRVEVKDQSVYNTIIGSLGGAAKPLDGLDQKNTVEKRYELARSIFNERLASMPEEDREAFAVFVTQNCTFIYIITDTFEDAFRLFTVVNDRGKQLRRIDVLKAYNLDPGFVTTSDSRTKYAQRWEELENRLGEAEFEDIFSLIRLILLKEKPQHDLYREFAERIFPAKALPDAGPEFMDLLENHVDLYDAVFVDKDFLDAPGGAEHVPYKTLMTAMVDYFSASEWKSCVLAFASKFGVDHLWEFILIIEKIYLDHWVTGTRKDERYGAYTDVLKKLETADEAHTLLAKIPTHLDNIKNACAAKNFYGAGYAKYLLVRAEIVTDELEHVRRFQARSIEHVCPQNPMAGGGWDLMFPPAEREELLNSAGNLVLLSKARNSSVGNREFEKKKKTYLEPRVSSFPRSIAVLKYEEWTPNVVKARTAEFAELVLTDPQVKP